MREIFEYLHFGGLFFIQDIIMLEVVALPAEYHKVLACVVGSILIDMMYFYTALDTALFTYSREFKDLKCSHAGDLSLIGFYAALFHAL